MSSDQGSGGSEKRQFWRLAVETWRTSGVSVRRFCKDEGLSSAAFYCWRRQLTRTVASGSDRQNDPLAPFIEVSIPRSTAALELVLTSGNVLRIGAAADSAALGRVVSVLREAGLC